MSPSHHQCARVCVEWGPCEAWVFLRVQTAQGLCRGGDECCMLQERGARANCNVSACAQGEGLQAARGSPLVVGVKRRHGRSFLCTGLAAWPSREATPASALIDPDAPGSSRETMLPQPSGSLRFPFTTLRATPAKLDSHLGSVHVLWGCSSDLVCDRTLRQKCWRSHRADRRSNNTLLAILHHSRDCPFSALFAPHFFLVQALFPALDTAVVEGPRHLRSVGAASMETEGEGLKLNSAASSLGTARQL